MDSCKKFILNTFFDLKFFYGFIFKVLNIILLDQNQNASHEKMPKFEQNDQKKLLDGCRTTLEFFLVKHIYIFVLVADTIFNNLTKNALKIFKLVKKI